MAKNIKAVVFKEMDKLSDLVALDLYKQREIYNDFLQYVKKLKDVKTGTILRHVSEYMTYHYKNEVDKEVESNISKRRLGKVILFIGDIHFPFEHEMAYDFVKETLLNHDKGNWNLDVDVAYSVKNSSDELKIIELRIPFNKREGSEVKCDEKYSVIQGNILSIKLEVQENSEKSIKVYYTSKIKGN